MTLKEYLKKEWREAAMLAIVAALSLEFLINLFATRTVWHRLTALEHSVQTLEHERELEELRTRSQLDEIRQKAQQTTDVIEKVEQKVEKKK